MTLLLGEKSYSMYSVLKHRRGVSAARQKDKHCVLGGCVVVCVREMGRERRRNKGRKRKRMRAS
jgi:hypothetical protein